MLSGGERHKFVMGKKKQVNKNYVLKESGGIFTEIKQKKMHRMSS